VFGIFLFCGFWYQEKIDNYRRDLKLSEHFFQGREKENAKFRLRISAGIAYLMFSALKT